VTRLPPPGSFVRPRPGIEDEPGGQVGRVVHYLDDSPERTGPLSVVVDFEEAGIGIYGLDDVEIIDPPVTFRGEPV
jgi:hypothetical protein